MAALNYATKYQQALANAFPYKLHFGELYNQSSQGNYKWVDEKTIKIPRLTTTGRIDADRDTIGQATRNFDNSWETKTLENERQWSTLVHPKDIDQTNQVASIANITRTFNEFQKFPEMDAYLISKLYSRYTTSISAESYTARTAITDTLLTSSKLDGDKILSVFDKMMLNMDNARVPQEGRILYVTHEVKAALKTAASIEKRWEVQQGGNGINRTVEYIDGIQVKGVPAELMFTVYNFTTGWAKNTSTGKQLNMFMVHPSAIITPINYTFAQLEAPSALSTGKWVYYEESHEDVFILNNLADALQFQHEA